MEAAIRSLLNRCSGTDALHLATLCRVPVRRLAHCVRTLDVTNFTLIRFLNQFAERTPSGVVPVDGENPPDLREHPSRCNHSRVALVHCVPAQVANAVAYRRMSAALIPMSRARARQEATASRTCSTMADARAGSSRK